MTKTAHPLIDEALARALGREVEITARRRLGGGDISVAERVTTTAGVFFLKTNHAPLPHLFESEAYALKRLRGAAKSLEVPRVVAFADSVATGLGTGFLITEFLEPGTRAQDFDERLGRGLAELHRSTAPRFGFEMDNYCGATPQPNPWTESWLEFYRESRLRNQIELASKKRLLDGSSRKTFDRLLGVLDDRLAGGEPDPPCLIHGDLWSGNITVSSNGGPALIDPASSFSHREAEFGMLLLFGGVSARVLRAYEEAWALPPGWRDRNPLYQLYHILNHANLFGGSYVTSAISVAQRFI